MDKVAKIVLDGNLFGANTALAKSATAKAQKALAKPTNKKGANKGAKRDYSLEKETSQLALFDSFMNWRGNRREGIVPELIQLAQSLILFGLPYRATKATSISRVARVGAKSFVRVTFHALGTDKHGKPIPLPFGADRTLLHYAINQAILTNSSSVYFDNPTQYLQAIHRSDSGENYRRLEKAIQRVSGLAITVERFESGTSGDSESRHILPILRSVHIPSRKDRNRDKNIVSIEAETHPGLHFDQQFFEEFMQFHEPFPAEILYRLESKPQMQDTLLFLHSRSYHARADAIIDWKNLRLQLWHDDSNTRRIKVRFREAIALFKCLWPELNAEATDRGLRIGPPHRGRSLIPAKSSSTN